ncbi:MAG TPA: ribonuclease J, partial [Polyangiaceae bacterium]|nr:ribonuclease J [Polyangiaceae bacterium]
FDDAPPDEETFDVARFEELGREGVRLLMSDSTNVDAAGATGSEEGVGRAIDAVVGAATEAVVVGVFASNVHRLRMLADVARRHDRKLVALGRSVGTHARVARTTARSTGAHAGRPYLEWPEDLVWPVDRARELPRRSILGVATGTQGEEAAALARLARGEHPAFELARGDVVVLSSRVIPGNEPDVVRLMNDLLRRGVEVRTWWSDRSLHVSGHAHRGEQSRMIGLVRPRAFIPVHGTLHHLVRHASLARELGVPEVCVLEDGDVAELGPDGLLRTGRVRAGRVHVSSQRVLPSAVLRDRGSLAGHGAAHVAVAIDASGRLASDVFVVTRGVIDEALDGHLLATARADARASVEEFLAASRQRGSLEVAFLDDEIAEVTARAVRRALSRVLGFKPVTTVSVLRVRR